MLKPLHLMTPEEKTELMHRMKAKGYDDDDFVGFLGNVNHLLWAIPDRPLRRRKPVARKKVKVAA
ncbi:MAG: hypothetical protein IPK32_21715 [Verrucomicrobiaceae bacterium]|nr:hypothetical protein [Verrucomicrobiaceae bacterium]